MKYKVGDRVVVGNDSGEIENADNPIYVRVVFDKDKEKHPFSSISRLVPVDLLSPDYRTLYEREKELREAAEKFIDESSCDPDIYPEQLQAWNHYQQLKQQYNGK